MGAQRPKTSPALSPQRRRRHNIAQGGEPSAGTKIPARQQEPIDLIIAQWRREKPKFDPSPMALFGAIARAYLLTSPPIEALMSRYGLARGMFDVLAALRRAGDPYRLPPSQLSRSLMLSGAGMTNRLDRLEGLGLIGRIPEPTDRRSVQIELTPKGRQIVEKIAPDLVQLERQMAAGFGKANVKMLTQLLIAFSSKLSDQS